MECVALEGHSKNLRKAIELREANGLSTSDIDSEAVKLWLLQDDNQLVGVGGIELSGEIGLLRSLAISQEYRGAGLGQRLCDVIFDYALKKEIERIYLLTETASEFFKQLGFIEMSRDDAPAELQVTAQFSCLCPDSAMLMIKT